LTLEIISTRQEAWDLDPILLVELLGFDTLSVAVLVYSPKQQLILFSAPYLLLFIFITGLLQTIEDLCSLVVSYGVVSVTLINCPPRLLALW